MPRSRREPFLVVQGCVRSKPVPTSPAMLLHLAALAAAAAAAANGHCSCAVAPLSAADPEADPGSDLEAAAIVRTIHRREPTASMALLLRSLAFQDSTCWRCCEPPVSMSPACNRDRTPLDSSRHAATEPCRNKDKTCRCHTSGKRRCGKMTANAAFLGGFRLGPSSRPKVSEDPRLPLSSSPHNRYCRNCCRPRGLRLYWHRCV
mmetsp:Transcript_87604/g.220411  ORF Transcript_87604/g.220411 Transcript_87604/m.220411 type:complete len:205 (-) Transcript_87604:390-1004(-)